MADIYYADGNLVRLSLSGMMQDQVTATCNSPDNAKVIAGALNMFTDSPPPDCEKLRAAEQDADLAAANRLTLAEYGKTMADLMGERSHFESASIVSDRILAELRHTLRVPKGYSITEAATRMMRELDATNALSAVERAVLDTAMEWRRINQKWDGDWDDPDLEKSEATLMKWREAQLAHEAALEAYAALARSAAG